MKTMQWLCAVMILLGTVLGQVTKPAAPPTFGGELDGFAKELEHEFVPAADAMPEDKYSFAPSSGEFKGVRTFAQQVKHVAAVNYIIGAGILGEKPPVDTGGENGPDSIKTKAEIVNFLKESFAYAHKAVLSIDEKDALLSVKSPFGDGMTTRMAMATWITGHGFDHYGQIVEYLRMNGIIPPASRR